MPFLIAIAGGSGSGKSTLAATLLDALPPGSADFLSEDWYYADIGAADDFDPATYDFDDLPVRDHARLITDLRELLGGHAIRAPEYDFVRHRRVDEHARRVEPRSVVVVEGAHLLCRPEVIALFDLRVFVDTPPDVRFIRRLVRDQAERGRTADSVIDQYLATVRPAHLRLVEPSRAHADLVIQDDQGHVSDADPVELRRLAAPLLSHPALRRVLQPQG